MTTRPDGLASKKGDGGIEIDVATNCFKMSLKPNWKLNQYRVDFNPAEDDTRIRKDLVKAHKPTLGRFLFDGTMLVTPQKYPKDPFDLTTKHPVRKYHFHKSLKIIHSSYFIVTSNRGPYF